MVCGHSFQNAKIPRASSGKKMMFWGFFVLKNYRPLSKKLSRSSFAPPACDHCAHSLYEHCAVAQNGFCDNGKYHEQYDTLHGHMRDTKNITQIDAANQQSHTTAYPDNPAKQIQRLADMIQNHKSHNGKEHGTGSGNVHLIDTKDPAENYQRAYHKEICQSRRQSFDQNIGQEPSVNGF